MSDNGRAFKTSVNGTPAKWGSAVWKKWKRVKAAALSGRRPLMANYWYREDGSEGFVYTVRGENGMEVWVCDL